MVACEFAEPAHVFIAVDPLKREEWSRKLGFRFGDRQTNARAAVIDGQDGSSGLFVFEMLCLCGHFLLTVCALWCRFATAPSNRVAPFFRRGAFLSVAGPFQRATIACQAAQRGRQRPRR